MGSLAFIDIAEDVLVWIFSFLEPPDILKLSETCKDIHKVAFSRVVWAHACSTHILSNGYPFPDIPVNLLSTRDLIYHTSHAYFLAKRWNAGTIKARRIKSISGTSGTSVSDVRFVTRPGHEDSLLLTISKAIWSALDIWFIGSDNPQKVCEWSPRGAIFSGFALNTDGTSEATIAISIHLNQIQMVKILSLQHICWLDYEIQEIKSLEIDMHPMTLMGDLVALADDMSRTAIWNWRTGGFALLEPVIEYTSLFQTNRCIQVLFTYQSILVVRARNMTLFSFPELVLDRRACEPYRPLTQHSFGWVDGECVNISPLPTRTGSPTTHSPLSILIRGESDNPWDSDIYNLELYTLDPNPSMGNDNNNDNQLPYMLPPRLTNTVACLRSSLTCKQIVLGRCGTAVWIQPRNRWVGGHGLLADIPPHLIPERTSAQECLIAAAFPGPLCQEKNSDSKKDEPEVRIGLKVFGNDFAGTSWTSFDYDEVGGRVALGSSFGRTTILTI